MSYIAGDDNMLRKVIDYIKKLREQAADKEEGALASPADPSLEKEAAQLYGLYQSDDITDEELDSIVADARREVYGD